MLGFCLVFSRVLLPSFARLLGSSQKPTPQTLWRAEIAQMPSMGVMKKSLAQEQKSDPKSPSVRNITSPTGKALEKLSQNPKIIQNGEKDPQKSRTKRGKKTPPLVRLQHQHSQGCELLLFASEQKKSPGWQPSRLSASMG